MNSQNESIIKNQNGQSFLEFIFLMLVIVSISFGFMRGMSSLVGNRWEAMVKVVAAPYGDDVSMP